MGCPSKVVVMMAKTPRGWQKRQNNRDRTPHPPHLPPKHGRGDMGWLERAKGRANSRCTRGAGDRPSALQVSGQLGSLSGSPHSPGTAPALVPTHNTIPPRQPWYHRTPRYPQEPWYPQPL